MVLYERDSIPAYARVVLTAVKAPDDQSVAALGDAMLAREIARDDHHMSEQRFVAVFNVVRRRDDLARNDQYMYRRGGSNVQKGDYARAQVPMLPVVRGEAVARRQILLYTLVLVAVTLAVVVTGALGLLYLAGAAVLGGVFIALAVVNLRNQRQRWSRLLFDYSIAYLGLLFAVMVADRMIGRL